MTETNHDDRAGSTPAEPAGAGRGRAPLCLLTVHAHPDDEASKGPATVARYHDEGVRTVLVCCTGGEEGEVLNPALDTPEVWERIAQVRRDELDAAATVIGYDEVEMLGYRDSGMAGSASNEHPDCFAAAPLDEAVGRLVALFRRHRPDVVVTYGDEQSAYPHPDHLRVHEVSLAAFEASGDPARYPGAGDPWQPSKLYYTMWSGERIRRMHEKFVELGVTSPFDEKWLARATAPSPVTTRVDVSGYAQVRLDALRAHATQVDPESPFWFGLPDEILAEIHPEDDYGLARSLVGGPVLGEDGEVPDGAAEDDLFAGLRSLAPVEG